MSDIKTTLGIIAVILTFVGYVPYGWSIIKGQTKPHIYSWIVWTLDPLIMFALQITHSAGMGAFTSLAMGLSGIAVIFLTIVKKNKSKIKFVDTLFLILAFSALILWLFAKQPLLSAVLITLVDFLGFAPTVRKSWQKPYSENIYFYMINTLRLIFTLASLHEYSLITTIYPVFWLMSNSSFALLLKIRRQKTIQEDQILK